MSEEIYVLVGCEESQEVTKAFREVGVLAFSCDFQECSGGHPEWHFKMDMFECINGGMIITQSGEMVYIPYWNLGIFHPPCTFLTVSANRWLKDQPERKSGKLVGAARRKAVEDGKDFFMACVNAKVERHCIENPIGVMSTAYRKPNQVIQPWMYGHGETKATCLWLRGLPRLNGFNEVDGREERIWKMSPGEDRTKERSKTYTGIAKAMAQQWLPYLKISSKTNA